MFYFIKNGNTRSHSKATSFKVEHSSRFKSHSGTIRRLSVKALDELSEKERAFLKKAQALMADEAFMKRHRKGRRLEEPLLQRKTKFSRKGRKRD